MECGLPLPTYLWFRVACPAQGCFSQFPQTLQPPAPLCLACLVPLPLGRADAR